MTDEQWKCVSERAAAILIAEAQDAAGEELEAETQKLIEAQSAVLAAQNALLKKKGDQTLQQVVNAALAAEKEQQQKCAECSAKRERLNTVPGQIEAVYRQHWDLLSDLDNLEAACRAREISRRQKLLAKAKADVAKEEAELEALQG